MPNVVVPLFLRKTSSYRHWLQWEGDPTKLRKVGRCILKDLEEAMTIIEELKGRRDDERLPYQWRVVRRQDLESSG